MNTERTTWRDVERAAQRLADAWQMAGGPIPRHLDSGLVGTTPATLTVSAGSTTNGHAGGIHWTPSGFNAADLPGGSDLPRSARDAYDTVTARSDALFSLAAARRNKHRELAALAHWWTEAHALDMPREAVALVGDLVAALTEGWPE